MMKRILASIVLLFMLATPAVADHPIQPSGSGFHKAQSAPRQSIKVWECGPCDVPAGAYTAWDTAAGWDMFVMTGDKDAADVRVVSAPPGVNTGTDIVGVNPNTGNYTLVIIYLEDWAKGQKYPTVHELGHALGFADHVFQYQFLPVWESGANPRVCDNENHWAYSPYNAVMSYCTPAEGLYPDIWGDNWFQKADKNMLYRQGYRANPVS